MKKRILIFLLCLSFISLTLAAVSFSGCNKDCADKDLLLHLAFDEGSGKVVKDSAKKQKDAVLHYVFNDAAFQPSSQDSQWRENGVYGGALLFDGYSNYIEYDYEDIKIKGSAFSISVYVAPRAFEWDNPDAVSNGTETLTAIVSQANKSDNEGFILGYQRHGNWSFQVGIGDRWISVWNEKGFEIQKYQWNHLIAVFDGANGEISVYLNGELAGRKLFFENSSISPAVSEPLLIGKNSKPGSNATASQSMVSGLMDEIKLYSVAISASSAKTYFEKRLLPEIKFEDIWLQNILTEDYYKTQLHGGPYQHWMNEPHAPIYYNGIYHLFFQFNLFGPYFRNICWGHLVSTDMVNWKPLKEVITPAANTVAPDGVWSGGATYDKNGVPLLFFTAGNDRYAQSGLISNQNIGVAYPANLDDPYLTEWVVCDELAVKQTAGQGRKGEFRDAHIWQENGVWCMIVGTGSTSSNGGSAILYTATDIECKFDGTVAMNWTYKGPIYEMKNQPGNLGSVWELPVVLPLKNAAGNISKHVFIISPAPASSADNKIYYFLGNFNVLTGKFTPDAAFKDSPRLFDYGCNVFTGPSGMIDPVSKNAYLFSIMQDQRKPGDVALSGWAHCAGFARKIMLNDDGSDVDISVAEALDSYEGKILYQAENRTIEQVNAALGTTSSDMVRIKAVLKNVSAENFGVQVKKGRGGADLTSFTYQKNAKTIVGATLNKGANASASKVSGALELKDDRLYIDILIDRSLVEAFFNETKAISIRSYAEFTSTGIEFFADGEVIAESVKITELVSIYDEG